MSDQQYQSITGAKELATLRKTALANATLHLFKAGFAPNVNTPLADFTTNEADYTTYAAKTIAAWNDPSLASVSGYNLAAPVQTFLLGATPAVPNMIGGWYLVHSDGTTLLDYGTFDPSRPMQLADQAIVLFPLEFFPAGATL